MVAGYGLTESTATVACENDNDHVVAVSYTHLDVYKRQVLYYKNGGNNADKDSLFLILTPGANFAQFKNMSLLAGASSYGLFGWGLYDTAYLYHSCKISEGW